MDVDDDSLGVVCFSREPEPLPLGRVPVEVPRAPNEFNFAPPPKQFSPSVKMIWCMSGKTCAACGKVLDADEIRLNERTVRVGRRRPRYLCRICRQREYNNYQRSIKELIEKKR